MKWHGSFLGGTVVKNLPANAVDTRDVGWFLGSGRSPRVRNSNPLRYACLENPMDRGAWWVTVHGVTKSWTGLSTHMPPGADTRVKPICLLYFMLIFHADNLCLSIFSSCLLAAGDTVSPVLGLALTSSHCQALIFRKLARQLLVIAIFKS